VQLIAEESFLLNLFFLELEKALLLHT